VILNTAFIDLNDFTQCLCLAIVVHGGGFLLLVDQVSQLNLSNLENHRLFKCAKDNLRYHAVTSNTATQRKTLKMQDENHRNKPWKITFWVRRKTLLYLCGKIFGLQCNDFRCY